MSQISASLNKIRITASSTVGQVREMGPRFAWIMLVVSLAEFLPWMLFLSGIVFSPESPSDNLSALLIVYMIICFAGYPLFVEGPVDNKISLRGQTILGCVLVGVGIALAYIGGTALPTIGLQVAGVILCALGKDLLSGRWYTHISRMTPPMAAFMAACGGALLAIVYIVLTYMANPVRIVFAIAAYLAVPLVASTRVRDYAPLGTQWVDSHAGAETFALQSRKSIIVLVMSISAIFGYFSIMVTGSGFFLQPDTGFKNAAALLALFVGILSLIGLVASLSSKNATSVLLSMTCTCLIIGAFALSTDSLRRLGIALIVLGFVFTDQFYCTFYCALCHLKKLRQSGARHIFRFSYKFVPLGIVLGGVLRFCVERYAASFDPEVVFALGCILFLAFLRVHTHEISSTRKEAASKSYSTISLDDIKRFSEAHSKEYGLSERECEVIHCFMNGRSVRATAQELFISENTVKSHAATIYRKLDVHKREDLINKVSKEIRE